jgi:hypothetical protein
MPPSTTLALSILPRSSNTRPRPLTADNYKRCAMSSTRTRTRIRKLYGEHAGSTRHKGFAALVIALLLAPTIPAHSAASAEAATADSDTLPCSAVAMSSRSRARSECGAPTRSTIAKACSKTAEPVT